MENISRLVYTMAVFKESLRMYPPVPTALCRVVTDPAGDTIAGQFVPPGVSLLVDRSTWSRTTHFTNNKAFLTPFLFHSRTHHDKPSQS